MLQHLFWKIIYTQIYLNKPIIAPKLIELQYARDCIFCAWYSLACF